MMQKVLISEYHDQDNESSITVHVNERVCLEYTIKDIRDDVVNDWDDQSNEYESIMERLEELDLGVKEEDYMRYMHRIIDMYNNYNQNDNSSKRYTIYSSDVRGSDQVDAAPKEAPCSSCKRMNNIGVNTCWCCGNKP